MNTAANLAFASPLEGEAVPNDRSARVRVGLPAPGDCDLCGRWDGRLSAGVCDECRSRYEAQDALVIPNLEDLI